MEEIQNTGMTFFGFVMSAGVVLFVAKSMISSYKRGEMVLGDKEETFDDRPLRPKIRYNHDSSDYEYSNRKRRKRIKNARYYEN